MKSPIFSSNVCADVVINWLDNQGLGQVAVPEEALAFDPSQAVQADAARLPGYEMPSYSLLDQPLYCKKQARAFCPTTISFVLKSVEFDGATLFSEMNC